MRCLRAVRHAWYELPEFPWPAELRRSSGEGSYPSGGAIQAYLRAYATRFDLLAATQTRTRVTSVAHQPDGWRVTVAPTGGADPGKATTARFSHVVIATGAYGAPFVPPVDGAAAFKGDQLPAAQFTSAARAAGKDVVVVGAGKSALDVAAAAAQTARSVTLLARKVHWPLAPFVGGIIPYEFAAYARLAKFGRAYYTAAPLQRAIHALFSPVKWLIWRIVEVLLRLQFRLGGALSPDEPIERDVYYTGQIYPRDDFFKAVRARKVKVLKGPCRYYRRRRRRRARMRRRPQLTTSCARRCGGAVAHCQRCCHHHRRGSAGAAGCLGHGPPQGLQVVRALYPRSAWRLLLPPLLLSRMLPLDRRADDWTRSRLDLQDDGLYLYRNIAPPLVPNLLFVGGEVTTYNNPLTHALQAEWVAALIAVRACCLSCPACCCRPRTAETLRVRVAQGKLALPPAEAQLRDVERLRAWRRSFIPANDARAAKYQLHGNQYHDQLVRDLGHHTLRKVCQPAASNLYKVATDASRATALVDARAGGAAVAHAGVRLSCAGCAGCKCVLNQPAACPTPEIEGCRIKYSTLFNGPVRRRRFRLEHRVSLLSSLDRLRRQRTHLHASSQVTAARVSWRLLGRMTFTRR